MRKSIPADTIEAYAERVTISSWAGRCGRGRADLIGFMEGNPAYSSVQHHLDSIAVRAVQLIKARAGDTNPLEEPMTPQRTKKEIATEFVMKVLGEKPATTAEEAHDREDLPVECCEMSLHNFRFNYFNPARKKFFDENPDRRLEDPVEAAYHSIKLPEDEEVLTESEGVKNPSEKSADDDDRVYLVCSECRDPIKEKPHICELRDDDPRFDENNLPMTRDEILAVSRRGEDLEEYRKARDARMAAARGEGALAELTDDELNPAPANHADDLIRISGPGMQLEANKNGDAWSVALIVDTADDEWVNTLIQGVVRSFIPAWFQLDRK